MNKYKNEKCSAFGHSFDSKHECSRYLVLRQMELDGKISGLCLQQRFLLIPAQRRYGKVVERGCYYIADFTYWENGKMVVEDAKGVKTDVYKIKKKLMLQQYNIIIREV